LSLTVLAIKRHSAAKSCHLRRINYARRDIKIWIISMERFERFERFEPSTISIFSDEDGSEFYDVVYYLVGRRLEME
jgi:hypothetical protein